MDSELDLVGRLCLGEETALSQLMDRYGTEVIRTASLLLKDRYLAEDISQEVFLKAYRKIGQYKGQGSLRSWLMSITVNLCRSEMRKAYWKRLFYRERMDWTQEASLESNENQLVERDSVSGYIRQLPYTYREVVVLFYYRQLSVEELAKLLNTNENTVKTRLARGRGILRKMMESGGEGHGSE